MIHAPFMVAAINGLIAMITKEDVTTNHLILATTLMTNNFMSPIAILPLQVNRIIIIIMVLPMNPLNLAIPTMMNTIKSPFKIYKIS